MLDVHPPHTSVHTWKDFLLHMATIVLGLLIAIGLEQSVEWLHHGEQRHQLLEQLDAEHKQSLKDAKSTQVAFADILNFTAKRIMAMQAVAWQNQRYVEPARPQLPLYNDPDDPVWRAAKSSGLTSFRARGEMTKACGRLPVQPAATEAAEYIHWDRKDVQDCLGGMSAYYEAMRYFYGRDAFVIGAEEAIEAGETDIDRVVDKEEQESHAASALLASKALALGWAEAWARFWS
jgi:hypothetical protein